MLLSRMKVPATANRIYVGAIAGEEALKNADEADRFGGNHDPQPAV